MSSARSIAGRRPSILALVETLLSAVVYFSVATIFDRQGWLLLAAVVAPILLLRSRASVAEGVTIFRRDAQIFQARPSFPYGVFSRSNWPLPTIFLVVGLGASLALVCGLIGHQALQGDAPSAAAEVARVMLLAWVPWTFTSLGLAFFTSALLPIRPVIVTICRVMLLAAALVGTVVGAVASGGTMTATGLFVWALLVSALLLSVPMSVDRFPASIYRWPLAVLLATDTACIGIALVSMPDGANWALVGNGAWVALGLGASLAVHLEEPRAQGDGIGVDSPFIRQLMMRVSAFTGLWSLPGWAAGFWVRTLGVRAWATLRHLPEGLRALPDNWRDNLVVIDLLHPPELLPRLGRVPGMVTVAQAWRMFRMPTRHWLEKVFMALQLPVSYIGLLYRWSLKSTLWLWWPLVLLLTPPFFGLTGEQLRVRTSESTRGHVARVKTFAALAISAWLVLFQWSDLQDAAKALPTVGNLVEFMLKFAPPTLGIRWLALMTMSLLTLTIWFVAARLTAAYEDPLKTPDKFASLNGEALAIFLSRARLIERLRLASVVSGVVLVYAVALTFSAEWYPERTARIIPVWLLGIL